MYNNPASLDDERRVVRLQSALHRNPWLRHLLSRFDEIDLPDAWIVAGCIAQTVWNLATGQPAERDIKDADLIYFDPTDLSAEAESLHEQRLRSLFPNLPIALDVKNEARVHHWYKRRFGNGIGPYRSSTDAIAAFPTTATAIGVRQKGGNFECCAPYFRIKLRSNRGR
jgi:uncharacterized protein